MLDDEFKGVYTDGMKPCTPFYDWLVVGFFVGMGTLLTCLSGCSAAGEGRELTVKPSRCAAEDIFDPGPPELETAVRYSASSWETAIGRPVCVEAGGLPIQLEVDVQGDVGHQVCGFTWQYYDNGPPETFLENVGIEIRKLDDTLNCYSYNQVLMHEMGHALGRTKAHTSTGLMQARATPDQFIDQAAIDLVCANSECY